MSSVRATPNTEPRVSIILELGTREITNKLSLDTAVNRVLWQQLPFAWEKVELILSGGSPKLPACASRFGSVKTVACGGYYEAKNRGAGVAEGLFLVFWDSDCRASPHYVAAAIGELERDQDLVGVTGVTNYDGESWLARLNTVLSFGYLHHGSLPMGGPALSHNVVPRRSQLPDPSQPFGPYLARSGGDVFLTDTASQRGRPIQLVRGMQVYHEDPSYSFVALLERHLREHFNPLLARREWSRWLAVTTGLESVLLSAKRRWKKLRSYGPALGFGFASALCALPVLAVHMVIDGAAVLLLCCWLPLLNRWLEYQFARRI